MPMDRFQEMTVFCAVVEEHGFASAARRLGLSAPAVTRSVAALEERIGARLLIRGARSIRLTESGQQFHEDCRRILAELELADELAPGGRSPPKGHVALSTPVLFGDTVLNPILLDFLEANPLVSMRAIFSDRVPDLQDDGIDVAMLMGAVSDPALVAIPVGNIHRVVCAAPAYLQAHGVPASVAELVAHRVVWSEADARAGEWQFACGDRVQSVRIAPRLSVSTNLAAIEAARSGWGLTRVMSYQVAAELAAGSLVALLVDQDAVDVPVHVAHLEGRAGASKVRSLVNFLVQRLRGHPALASLR
jgi:DNA-binding transcriptional LysR family regulator